MLDLGYGDWFARSEAERVDLDSEDAHALLHGPDSPYHDPSDGLVSTSLSTRGTGDGVPRASRKNRRTERGSMKSGDKLTTDSGQTFHLGELVATQGRADCTSPMCRRRFAPGDPPEGVCAGYHCPKCGEPTSMMGHRCPRDN